MNKKDLFKEALKMKERAYVSYSHSHVGACVSGNSGKIYRGCNIETASYSPTICTERVTIFKAISNGVQSIQIIAITGDAKDTMPCGVCRRVVAEFANPSMKVYIVNREDDFKGYSLEELLPFSFSKKDLEKETR